MDSELESYFQTQNEFLDEYLSRRHSILIELIRHKSIPSLLSCSNCQQESGTYWCRDCFGPHFWCSACCVSAHVASPFHRVQMWNGNFFERSELLTRELTLNLCHSPDDCPSVPFHTGA